MIKSFEELDSRHAWTEEEEWAGPETSDLVNFFIFTEDFSKATLRSSNFVIFSEGFSPSKATS